MTPREFVSVEVVAERVAARLIIQDAALASRPHPVGILGMTVTP